MMDSVNIPATDNSGKSFSPEEEKRAVITLR
jgi:hypothetical protein